MRRVLGRLWQAGVVLLIVLGLCYYILYVSDGQTGDVNSSFMEKLLESEGQEGWAIFADDCQNVLEGSAARFIGYHPIDENFLLYVATTYGLEGFHEIANTSLVNSEEWFNYTGKSIHVLWYEYCDLMGLGERYKQRVQVVPVEDEEFVIKIAGDTSFAEKMATTEYMDQQMNGISDCFSDALLEYMNSASVTIVNNEFAFSNGGTPLEGKAYTYRANPHRIESYEALGVDLINLANNHVYDYGEKAFVDTLQTITDNGYVYVGAGRNLEEAMQPYYYIYGGRKIAVVTATQIEREEPDIKQHTKQATVDSPGVMKTSYDGFFLSEIEVAAKNADVVICIPHWGTEGSMVYGNDQYRLARDFAIAGASVIVGGHPHCLQTVEYIGTVPVYYSLGNFYFSYSSNMPAPYDTAIAEIRIGQDKHIETRFVPCLFSDGNICLASEKDEQERVITSISKLSKSANIDPKTGEISLK